VDLALARWAATKDGLGGSPCTVGVEAGRCDRVGGASGETAVAVDAGGLVDVGECVLEDVVAVDEFGQLGQGRHFGVDSHQHASRTSPDDFERVRCALVSGLQADTR
jgi:hypothetical protein